MLAFGAQFVLVVCVFLLYVELTLDQLSLILLISIVLLNLIQLITSWYKAVPSCIRLYQAEPGSSRLY